MNRNHKGQGEMAPGISIKNLDISLRHEVRIYQSIEETTAKKPFTPPT